MADPIQQRAERVLKGEVLEAARLIRDLDDQIPGAVEVLKILHPHTGRARIVGVTGNPGSGKSTVVDGLISWYRKAGRSVGVVAIDPTSPFTGGAILGDRIRMQRHATDSGVFIRSMATRGHLGGLSRSAADAIAVMDAMGRDVVLVETVGVGQDEVDIVTAAETSVVTVVPGLGDEIQAIKAGILEIADILLVNKADLHGADRTVADLCMMLDLRSDESKEVPVLRSVATRNEGIRELAEAIEAHKEQLDLKGLTDKRALLRAQVRVTDLLKERLLREASLRLMPKGGIEALARKVADRQIDPYTAVESAVSLMLDAEK
jgi:LAO/AO transport system kinase